MGHIRLKQAPEEIRTHLGQALGGNHIHPEQQGLHRQEQELEQEHMMGLGLEHMMGLGLEHMMRLGLGHMMGLGQGHKRELEQGLNRTGQGQR